LPHDGLAFRISTRAAFFIHPDESAADIVGVIAPIFDAFAAKQ
jgi:hypothetical protein